MNALRIINIGFKNQEITNFPNNSSVFVRIFFLL